MDGSTILLAARLYRAPRLLQSWHRCAPHASYLSAFLLAQLQGWVILGGLASPCLADSWGILGGCTNWEGKSYCRSLPTRLCSVQECCHSVFANG